MHKTDIVRNTLFLLLLSIPLSNISCSRSQESWVNFTNANCVITLATEGNYIWVGTDGGVVKWNINNGEYIKFTSADVYFGRDQEILFRREIIKQRTLLKRKLDFEVQKTALI